MRARKVFSAVDSHTEGGDLGTRPLISPMTLGTIAASAPPPAT